MHPRSAVDLAMQKTRAEESHFKAGEVTDRPFDPSRDLAMERTVGDGQGFSLGIDLAKPGGDHTIVRIDHAAIDRRNAREVAIGQNPFVQKKEALVSEMVSSKYSMRRRGRMIPERGRMVVARVEWDEKLGSIFILDNHVKQLTESNQEVVILACGPLRIDPVTGKEVPMRFSIEDVIGRHCVIREHSGIEFITYDENGKVMICYWIGQSEIWGWLEPYPGDEVNSEEIWKAIAYLGEGATPPTPAPAACDKFCAICSIRPCDTVHELGEIPHLCSDCVPSDMVWAIPEGTVLCEMHKTYFAVQPAHVGREIPYEQLGCCEYQTVRIVSA